MVKREMLTGSLVWEAPGDFFFNAFMFTLNSDPFKCCIKNQLIRPGNIFPIFCQFGDSV